MHSEQCSPRLAVPHFGHIQGRSPGDGGWTIGNMVVTVLTWRSRKRFQTLLQTRSGGSVNRDRIDADKKLCVSLHRFDDVIGGRLIKVKHHLLGLGSSSNRMNPIFAQ
jgi:hypothetical protein